MIAAWLVASALLILAGADPLATVVVTAVVLVAVRVTLAVRANAVYTVRGRIERW